MAFGKCEVAFLKGSGGFFERMEWHFEGCGGSLQGRGGSLDET